MRENRKQSKNKVTKHQIKKNKQNEAKIDLQEKVVLEKKKN